MIFRSPYEDVDIPSISLPEFVLETAAQRGDKPALIDGSTGRTITYEGFVSSVNGLAAGLAARDFGKGDVFAILAPNLPEYAVAFHGAALTGGTVTTINPLYKVDEVAFQLNDCAARYLLTIPQFVDQAKEAAARSKVEEIFVLGEAEGATPFASLFADPADAPSANIDPDDLVVLPYSSGTTGFPKGVMLTHRNIVANVCQSAPQHATSERDVIVGVLPFFHIYGMTVIMNIALRRGATIVTMPRFDLGEFLRIVQDYAVTRAYLVPPIVLALAKQPAVDQFDLSKLEVIMSGAAPLSGDLTNEVEKRIGCQVMQGYGLTETSPVTHMIPDEPGRNRASSIGFPLPNTECKIVDVADGRELGTDEAGELWIRGPQVMKGYLNNPEATAATMDAEGWFHTGDIAKADDDGYFYIVDRLKELIKYKGYQVPPAELEALLLTHPAIADAAVIPVPDEEAGEIPKAYVVLKDELSPEDVMAYVAERVAPHKKIRRVEVVDEIPKSASGKILRRVLIEREKQGA